MNLKLSLIEGKVILPLIGPINFLGMSFDQASRYLENKVKTELIGTDALSIKEIRSIGVYLLEKRISRVNIY